MKGFQSVAWSGNLPDLKSGERSFEAAVEAWYRCWEKVPISQMIANLRDCHVLPAAVGNGPLTKTASAVVKQAWVSSPWSAFGPYAFAEASKIPGLGARMGAKAGALASASVLALMQPDRCQQIRSFLFSTPIHPPQQNAALLSEQMQDLAEVGGTPVLCRGLAQLWRPEEIQEAKARGLIALPTRVVWLYDGRQPQFLERHNTVMDLALARKATPLQLIDANAVEPWVWARLAELYSQLYLQKHNPLNPAYTAQFMQRAAASGLIEFFVFPSPAGKGIDAFVGLFSGAGQSTCPLVGVELSLQKSRGLYRMACALCFGLAAVRQQQLNFSSGAGQFKRLRGGVQSLEYALLALPQASRYRTICWRHLASAVARWVAPMLLKEAL